MMDKKEKTEAAKEECKCCCNKSCDCGCQEGKECTCGCGCGCGCCCKKKVFKVLAVLVIFLAGMGFQALLQCGFRCSMSKPRPMPVQTAPIPAMPMPAYSDAQGGNIIIINTDGSAGMEKFLNNKCCSKDCGCKKIKRDHDHHSHKDHDHHSHKDHDHHSHKKDKHPEFRADRHAHMPEHAPMAPEAVK